MARLSRSALPLSVRAWPFREKPVAGLEGKIKEIAACTKKDSHRMPRTHAPVCEKCVCVCALSDGKWLFLGNEGLLRIVSTWITCRVSSREWWQSWGGNARREINEFNPGCFPRNLKSWESRSSSRKTLKRQSEKRLWFPTHILAVKNKLLCKSELIKSEDRRCRSRLRTVMNLLFIAQESPAMIQ